MKKTSATVLLQSIVDNKKLEKAVLTLTIYNLNRETET